MSDIHQHTAQEILNLVLRDLTLKTYWHDYTDQEVLNLVYDSVNAALRVYIDHIDTLDVDNLTADVLALVQQATSPTPITGQGVFYTKADGKPYFKFYGGAEIDLSATGAEAAAAYRDFNEQTSVPATPAAGVGRLFLKDDATYRLKRLAYVGDNGIVREVAETFPNYALQAFNALPNNRVLYDQFGFPSVYVFIPKFNWDPTNGFASTTVFPAFIWGGVEHAGFWVSKYEACAIIVATGAIKATQTADWSASVAGHVAASLPYQDPMVFLNYNAAIDLIEAKNSAAMRADGNIFHVMTNAEWSAVAIWCKQMYKDAIFASYCRGNNNFCRDIDNKGITGLPLNETLTIGLNGGSYGTPYYGRWRTGSGGARTAHNFDPSGIFDMNGNVWERVVGLQSPSAGTGKQAWIIPNNEAAIASVAQLKDIVAAPGAPWVQIGEWASLTDEDFSKENITNFIGYSKTSGSLVIGVRYIITTYVAGDDFTNVGAASNATGVVFTATGTTPTNWINGSTISLYDVERLALCAHSDVTADYGSDYFYKPNVGENNVPRRGGDWSAGVKDGMFDLVLSDVATSAYNAVGLRSAFVGDLSSVT